MCKLRLGVSRSIESEDVFVGREEGKITIDGKILWWERDQHGMCRRYGHEIVTPQARSGPRCAVMYIASHRVQIRYKSGQYKGIQARIRRDAKDKDGR